MTFVPFNRFIHVIPLEDDKFMEETPVIIMPDDLKGPRAHILSAKS